MTLVSARRRLAICLGVGTLPLLVARRAAAQQFEFRLGHPLDRGGRRADRHAVAGR